MDESPIQSFASKAAFAAWLAKHHRDSPGLWLRISKKGGPPSVSYPEAVDVALCHGWIDGQKRKADATTWLQKFTPRRKRSVWSKINRDKALALIKAGAMKPAGLAEVERAKADGRWAAAYDSAKNMAVPADLTAALAKDPKAKAFFAQLSASNRYAILWRLHTAKKPETRQRRLETFLAMLSANQKLHA